MVLRPGSLEIPPKQAQEPLHFFIVSQTVERDQDSNSQGDMAKGKKEGTEEERKKGEGGREEGGKTRTAEICLIFKRQQIWCTYL